MNETITIVIDSAAISEALTEFFKITLSFVAGFLAGIFYSFIGE